MAVGNSEIVMSMSEDLEHKPERTERSFESTDFFEEIRLDIELPDKIKKKVAFSGEEVKFYKQKKHNYFSNPFKKVTKMLI